MPPDPADRLTFEQQVCFALSVADGRMVACYRPRQLLALIAATNRATHWSGWRFGRCCPPFRRCCPPFPHRRWAAHFDPAESCLSAVVLVCGGPIVTVAAPGGAHLGKQHRVGG